MNPYTLKGKPKNLFRHAKVDKNQAEIVRALRQVGASVTSLADVGQGCPDLLVGFQGKTFLIEVKNPKNHHGNLVTALTPAQVTWHLNWKGGPVDIVKNPIRALSVIGVSNLMEE